jgi:hypothetical protein
MSTKTPETLCPGCKAYVIAADKWARGVRLCRRCAELHGLPQVQAAPELESAAALELRLTRERTKRDLEEQEAARQRALADTMVAVFYQLRAQGHSMTEAFALIEGTARR